jgi:hypothetical protein
MLIGVIVGDGVGSDVAAHGPGAPTGGADEDAAPLKTFRLSVFNKLAKAPALIPCCSKSGRAV